MIASVRSLIALAALLAVASATQAQTTYIWNNSGGTAWATTTNWLPIGVPGSTTNTNADTATFAALNGSSIGLNFGNLGTPFFLGEIVLDPTNAVDRLFGSSSGTAGTLILNGVTSGSDKIVLDNQSNFGMTINPLNGGAGAMAVQLNGVATVNAVGTGFIAISANIGQAATSALKKTGSGVLTLSGTNSYTGATSINGGMLRVASIPNGSTAGPIGSSSSAVSNLAFGGGTLDYTGATASTDRGFTVNAGGGGITVPTGVELTFTGGMAGANNGTFDKNGAGTLTLFNTTNTYTGTLNINAGTVKSAANGTLPAGAVVNIADVAGANLDNSSSFTATIGGLSGGAQARVKLGSSNILTINQATNTTYAGQFTTPILAADIGTPFVNKTGAGILALASASAHVGGVSVSGGTLRVSNASGSAVGPNGAVVNGGGKLDGTGSIGGGSFLNQGGTLQGGTGGFTQSANTLPFAAGLTFDGANTIRTVFGDTDGRNNVVSPTASRVIVAGMLVRNTGGNADLTTIKLVSLNDAYEYNKQYTVTVMTFASSQDVLLSNFTIDPNPENFTFNGTPSLLLTGTQLQVTFVPLPEPFSLGAIALGGVALALRRRVRKG